MGFDIENRDVFRHIITDIESDLYKNKIVDSNHLKI